MLSTVQMTMFFVLNLRIFGEWNYPSFRNRILNENMYVVCETKYTKCTVKNSVNWDPLLFLHREIPFSWRFIQAHRTFDVNEKDVEWMSPKKYTHTHTPMMLARASFKMATFSCTNLSKRCFIHIQFENSIRFHTLLHTLCKCTHTEWNVTFSGKRIILRTTFLMIITIMTCFTILHHSGTGTGDWKYLFRLGSVAYLGSYPTCIWNVTVSGFCIIEYSMGISFICTIWIVKNNNLKKW